MTLGCLSSRSSCNMTKANEGLNTNPRARMKDDNKWIEQVHIKASQNIIPIWDAFNHGLSTMWVKACVQQSVWPLYPLHRCVFTNVSLVMHLACCLRLLCLLNRSYSVKVNVTLHKPTWSWEQQCLTKTRQRRAEWAPSPRSLCRLTWRCQCLQSAWGRSPYHPSCKQRDARRHHPQT